ncbi:ferredoxin reductase, partial [Salmonella enterica subsp. enterica serovar Uganda]|nr:ferredoxin reductase [Salmonella enterica subsp. enterica serovar Uganda]
MVIVGAGECGARAALELREAGYAGPVTLVGAEIHLPYERPPLSKDAMTEEEAQPRTVLDETRLAELGVRHIAGNAAETIDRQARILRLADGSVLPYE